MVGRRGKEAAVYRDSCKDEEGNDHGGDGEGRRGDRGFGFTKRR